MLARPQKPIIPLFFFVVLIMAYVSLSVVDESEITSDDVLWAMGLNMVKVPIPGNQIVYAGFYINVHKRDQTEPVHVFNLGPSLSIDEQLSGEMRVSFGYGTKPLVDKETELFVVSGSYGSRGAAVFDLSEYGFDASEGYFSRWVPSENIEITINKPIPIFQVASGPSIRYDIDDIENLVTLHDSIATLYLILMDHLPETYEPDRN